MKSLFSIFSGGRRLRVATLVCLPALPLMAGPLVVNGLRDMTYSNLTISNPTGHCIEVRNGAQNIRIVNSVIGPCGGAGVHISSSTNVILDNVQIRDTKGNGVEGYYAKTVQLTNSRIENTSSGVYIQDGSAITVMQNRFINVVGPGPRGQFVQFNRVNGPGSKISCNVGENIWGQSTPEDAINLFDSNGDAASPILIQGNKIKGGGPSVYGGGIMLGDGGGSWQVAKDNILVDPGQYGVAVAGGNNIQVLENRVYARQQSFTNVGIYVWNQYAPACFGHTVQGNTVDWTNSTGQKNPAWNAGNCGTVTGMSSNNWNATLSDTIFYDTVSACQLGDTTPPTVRITAPAAGQTVAGVIAVSADALDASGIAGVTFTIDGTLVGTERTTAPYSTSIDTTKIANGSHVIQATARDQAGNRASTQITVQVYNTASTPLTQRYLSDLPYQVVTNSWGPAEKDMSNGEWLARDGRTITIGGVRYSKGIGVHAYSDLRYAMKGLCTSFTARVGVDDEVAERGSLIFQVWADGAKLYDSGIMTGAMGSKAVSVNVTGKSELKLIVTDSGSDYSSDHGDWAMPQLTCRF